MPMGLKFQALVVVQEDFPCVLSKMKGLIFSRNSRLICNDLHILCDVREKLGFQPGINISALFLTIF